jgi:aquaporin Z
MLLYNFYYSSFYFKHKGIALLFFKTFSIPVSINLNITEGPHMTLPKLDLRPRVLLAELFGTFVLTTIVVTVANPIIIGFAVVVLVYALYAVSGSHLNPAVTIGLWTVRRFDGIKVPFYLAMQFLGAVLALLLTQAYQSNGYGISFASFGQFDAKILVAELLGTAVFVFAFASAVQKDLLDNVKSVAIGLALLTGLAVGGGLLGVAAQNATSSAANSTPRIAKIDGAVLNPAIALASSEKSDQQNQLQQTGATTAPANEKRPSSRFTLETLVGGVLGGALGANLAMVIAGVNPFSRNDRRSAVKVTKVTRKTTASTVKSKARSKRK